MDSHQIPNKATIYDEEDCFGTGPDEDDCPLSCPDYEACLQASQDAKDDPCCEDCEHLKNRDCRNQCCEHGGDV